MTDQTEVRLPPLPEFFGYIGTNDLDPDAGEEGYLAYQMQEYARLAVMEERERCARICESLRDKWVDGSDQFGRPCPARVRVTPADCAAAIRNGKEP